ncbi:hypothetical protein BC629DRAFT_1165950 [Irpex lacteus]|nr:hypothetical protein BC629DRAFT_1165950 [Irpex lacteus]
MLCWSGIWILCLSPTTNGGEPGLPGDVKAAQRGSVVSPIFTVLLLMFASGMPTAEKPTAKKFFLMFQLTSSSSLPHPTDDDVEYPAAWSKYKRYLASTSILVPIPPALYRPLPEWVKKTVLLDFPMYRLYEGKNGREALDERRWHE